LYLAHRVNSRVYFDKVIPSLVFDREQFSTDKQASAFITLLQERYADSKIERNSRSARRSGSFSLDSVLKTLQEGGGTR
jgi:hypothetical protein